MNTLKTLFTIFSYAVASLVLLWVCLLVFPFVSEESRVTKFLWKQANDLESHVDQLETDWQNKKK